MRVCCQHYKKIISLVYRTYFIIFLVTAYEQMNEHVNKFSNMRIDQIDYYRRQTMIKIEFLKHVYFQV